MVFNVLSLKDYLCLRSNIFMKPQHHPKVDRGGGGGGLNHIMVNTKE